MVKLSGATKKYPRAFPVNEELGLLMSIACGDVEQLSDVVGCAYVTTAPQFPGSLATIISAVQDIVGSIESSTVTVVVQVSVFPELSVTVRVMVLFPTSAQLKDD